MRGLKFRAWCATRKQMVTLDPKTADLENLSDLNEDADWKVMQFTGLTDKNGEEIYEGDILNWSSWKLGFKHIDGSPIILLPKKVVWQESAWQLEGDIWNLAIYDNIEVIGNIYENPELLNGEGKE